MGVVSASSAGEAPLFGPHLLASYREALRNVAQDLGGHIGVQLGAPSRTDGLRVHTPDHEVHTPSERPIRSPRSNDTTGSRSSIITT